MLGNQSIEQNVSVANRKLLTEVAKMNEVKQTITINNGAGKAISIIVIPLKWAASILGVTANNLHIRYNRNKLPIKVYPRGGRLFFGEEDVNRLNQNGNWKIIVPIIEVHYE